MRALLLPLHRTFLILVAATVASFWMRSDDLVGVAVGGTTLAIAWLKGRLVVLDYMELREAPILWRGLAVGWLLLTTILLFSFYLLGRTNGA